MINHTYRATIRKIVDGDTFDASVDLGFTVNVNVRFRLNGIDTPETYVPSCEAEKIHGKAAKDFTAKMMPVGTVVEIKSHKMGVYNRYDADVTLPSGVDLATLLRENGFEKKASYA